jgi:hypothetical protein
MRIYGRIGPGLGVSFGPLSLLIVGPLYLLWLFLLAMAVLLRLALWLFLAIAAIGLGLAHHGKIATDARRAKRSHAARRQAEAAALSQEYNDVHWHGGDAAARGLVGNTLRLKAERARQERLARERQEHERN